MRKLNKIFFTLCPLFLVFGLFFIWQNKGRTIEIDNFTKTKESELNPLFPSNPISGLSCQNYNRRPIAVVLANDPAARPLSGISEADLVFEMPVITGSITRIVAVYICSSPEEIGSLRSARHDFIPLVMGLDAVLIHWGGSHFALDKLNTGIMNNIDALKNPYNGFYQKKEMPQPHNGFTSMERLTNSAEKLGYRLEGEFKGYFFQSQTPNLAPSPKLWSVGDKSQKYNLKIDYSYPYTVEYQYNPKTNSYLRWRAGKPEIDKNNNQPVAVKNIVIMRAASRQIEGPDYNDLDIEGEGECQVYQNSESIECAWIKDKNDPKSKLYFLDKSGQEIKFVPGQIWIQIVEPNQKVTWTQ